MGVKVKTEGVQGEGFSKIENKGRVVTFVDNETNHIQVNGFEGQGENYKEREQAEISVFGNGKEWVGTFDKFIKKLTE